MAATVVNGPTPTPLLSRGRPFNLGTVTTTSSAVQFTVPQEMASPNGVDILFILTTGTAGTTPTLEFSIDGGNSWAVIAARTAPALTITGQIGGDTAATSAQAYEIQGLQAGAVFRWGFVAGTPNAAVWALIG